MGKHLIFDGSGGLRGKAPHDDITNHTKQDCSVVITRVSLLEVLDASALERQGTIPPQGAKNTEETTMQVLKIIKLIFLSGSKSRIQGGCELCCWRKENTDLLCGASTKSLACHWENLIDLSPQAEPKYSPLPPQVTPLQTFVLIESQLPKIRCESISWNNYWVNLLTGALQGSSLAEEAAETPTTRWWFCFQLLRQPVQHWWRCHVNNSWIFIPALINGLDKART